MLNPSPLLFDDKTQKEATRRTTEFCENYLEKVSDMPVYPPVDRNALSKLMQKPLPRQGESLSSLFEEFDHVIIPNATHTAHPKFLPYVQASPNGLAPYADQVAATINQNCNLWTLSPSANAVEQTVLRWFCDLFGLGSQAGGIMTSGGSVANLVGLTAARDHYLGEDARTKGVYASDSRLIAYMSEETHSSIDKAISILGLGTDNLRKIPTTDDFTLDVEALARAIAADRTAGHSPFCVIASAGTVTTGSFDPIKDIATICQKNELWLHVDGAYGALTALSERYRERLSAISFADSVTLDPHKFLFCPFEASCILVKDRNTLRNSFSASPSYLTMVEDDDFLDFANYGPQLSRSFKALKVWWSLKHFGADAYASVIDRMADLAAYMGEQCSTRDEFELLAPVTFNCVCFRLKVLDADGNKRVLSKLIASGKAFLGPASVKTKTGIRACFMNLRTTQNDIDEILDDLAVLASKDMLDDFTAATSNKNDDLTRVVI